MNTVTYINESGQNKTAQIPTSIYDYYLRFDEEDSLYYYHHPISGKRYLLHSVGDNPALIEDGNRIHYMWNGCLHRLNGPAFTSEVTKEYYAFNIHIDEDHLLKYADYLAKVEKICLKYGINMYHIPGSQARYELAFIDIVGLLEDAEDGILPILDLETATITEHNVSDFDLGSDSSKERSATGLIAVGLGVAAAALAVTHTDLFVSKQKEVVSTVKS